MVCAVTGSHIPIRGRGSARKPERAAGAGNRSDLPHVPAGRVDAHVMLRICASSRRRTRSSPLVWDERRRNPCAAHGRGADRNPHQRYPERFGVDRDVRRGQHRLQGDHRRTVEGVGHFEPLRHYAEVHLLLEPAPRGSGIQLATACPTDVLDLNWQRLILTHLARARIPAC